MSEPNFEVKIPNIMNPFTVEVNGKTYSFPAGTTQMVNQEVYDVIRNIESMVPTPNHRAGEPSFESLRDRPFGESTEVLFDQRVEFQDVGEGVGEGMMGCDCYFPELLEAGTTYIVTYNGVSYNCIPLDPAGVGPSALGNMLPFGAEDTGEPFLIAVPVNEVEAPYPMTILSINGDTSATIRIEKSVIHPIDPKYLPETGAGFNVNVWYENGEYVSNKTYEQIKAAEAAKTPITGTLTIADGKVFTLIGADASAYAWVNLVAFDLNRTPSVYVYKVEIFENAYVAVEIFSVSGTKVTNTDVYPK